jgi:hypothetical protein
MIVKKYTIIEICFETSHLTDVILENNSYVNSTNIYNEFSSNITFRLNKINNFTSNIKYFDKTYFSEEEATNDLPSKFSESYYNVRYYSIIPVYVDVTNLLELRKIKIIKLKSLIKK